jgi:hypothetical protein
MRSGPGFWARQFGDESTPAQTVFDLAFGLFLPLICLGADPAVFTPDGPLSNYQAMAYVVVGLEAGLLAVWLLLRRWAARSAAFYAGPLLAGAVLALGIGVAILPLSAVGLFFGIGVFGFVPFFTSVVFLRNGVRALRRTQRFLPPWVGALLLLAGAFLVACAAVLVHADIGRFGPPAYLPAAIE